MKWYILALIAAVVGGIIGALVVKEDDKITNHFWG